MRNRNGAGTLAVASATLLLALLALTILGSPAEAAISFVQGNYAAPQSSQSTVTVALPAAQTEGDLNVVIVGWNDTAVSITSVTDSRANSYALAVGPTKRNNRATQSIYYARNIAAGANTVTVRFSGAASFPDVRVLQYRGLDAASPLIAAVGASGSSATSSTGAVTVPASSPNALLVAGNVVASSTRSAGSGFTSRMITSPNGDIAEDRAVTAAGSYSASAALTASGYWVIQLAAFRAAAAGDTTPPTIAITAPTSAATFATSTTPIALGGTASDPGGVTQVSWTSDRGGSGTATGTTSWSVPSVALQPGANVLTVTARDAAGNIQAAILTVTYTAPGGGLVAAYAFNEGSGPTVADLSGNNNGGTLNGATWAPQGKYGSALSFNGSSYVTVADSPSLDLTTGMTLEAWVYPTALGGWNTAIMKEQPGEFVYTLYAGSSGSAPNLYFNVSTTSSGERGLAGPSQLPLNTWSHLAGTYDGTTLRLYVNGVVAASQAQTGAIATSTGALRIGGNSIWGEFFTGLIDEVRIYNRALSAAEIQADMAAPLGGSGTDTQKPTAPGTPTATPVSATAVDLSWGAAQDNVGVTGYRVERCTGAGCTTFAEIAAPPGTAYGDTGLAAGTTYRYQVRASDAAGNLGPYSTAATVTTPALDSTPPTAPGTLTATAVSGSQVNLGWGAAQDNVGVTAYRVERCQGAGCTDFIKVTVVTGLSFSDAGLAPNTAYGYVVRASDAAGNLGAYSNAAYVTTLSTVPELVAAYGFEEGAGPTATDSSGRGNNGTLAGAAWTPAGKYGKALTFNGTTARVTIPDSSSLRLTTGMTLEAWVNPSVVTSGWRDVIYKGNDNYFLEGTSSNGGVPAAGGTFGEVYGAAALAANTWTHLAVTYDGSTLRFYVNGAQVSSTAQTGAIATSANPLEIGGDSIFGQYFQGSIDEVRVYNVARTPAQIQADMNTPVGSVSLPVMSVSPSSIDFGSQPTGTPSDPRTVTLTNVGGASMNISGVAITGPNPGDFSQTTTCGATLAAGASCAVSARFTPTTTGARTASVSVTDTAPGSPHTASLTGTGTGFSISPRVAVLTRTQVQQFTATGGGAITWSVDGVVGGNAASGTISTAGLYTPPSTPGTHTVTAASSPQSSSASVYISGYSGTYTQRNDNAGTGANVAETVLTPTNVTSAAFGKLFSYQLDGVAQASPLYAANVNVPGRGFRNVVYVATEHDTVYAFDADGGSATPLWQVSFINPASGVTTVPASDTGECCDIAPEIGITGTPVIDPLAGTLYVVAKTKETTGGSTRYVQRLHALDMASGASRGAVEIQASVPGTGGGSQGGQLAFDPLRQNQRPALILVNGVVYIAFASHGDIQPYHGWLLGYDAATLQRVFVWNSTPNGASGGIWLSNAGPTADAAGNIYVVTANGPFNPGAGNWGDTILKLRPDGTIADYFTPANQAILESGNIDLGSSGALLLPDQPGLHPHLLVQSGKNGSIYLIDRDNMGHNTNDDRQVVQALVDIFPFGTPEPGNYSAPVYWNGSVFFSPVADAVKAFRLTNGALSTFQTSQSAQVYPYPGGTLAVSANGNSSGILWAIQRNTASTPATLRAYDPTNLAVELYNSDQAGTRDRLDVGAKFSLPVVANGKVFVGSAGRLTVFGLLP